MIVKTQKLQPDGPDPDSTAEGGFRGFFPTCREVARIQSKAAGSLSFRGRMTLRLHLLVCGWCRRYEERIRFLSEFIRRQPTERAGSAAHHLSMGARERLQRALERESGGM